MITHGPSFTAYAVGFVYASICTSLPIDEALDQMNHEHPTGIESKWTHSTDPMFSGGRKSNPCPCEENPETHKHYLLSC